MLNSQINISVIENKILSIMKNSNVTSKYFDDIKNKCENNQKALLKVFECFLRTNISEVKFSFLEAMTDVISRIHPKMEPQVKIQLRKLIYQSIINRDFMLSLTNAKFLMVKFSYFLVLWLFFDYPENMQNVFDDLNEMIINTQKLSEQIQLVKFYIEILFALNDKFIVEPINPAKVGNANYILNFMKSNATKRFTFILRSVFLNYSQFDICNINDAIRVVSQLLRWNPFSSLQDISYHIITNLIFIKEHRFYSLCVIKDILKKLPEEGDTVYFKFVFDTINQLLTAKDNEEKEFYLFAKILNKIAIITIKNRKLNIELSNDPYLLLIPPLIHLFEKVIKSKCYKAINKLYPAIKLFLELYFHRKTDETYGPYCDMIKGLIESLSENRNDMRIEDDYYFKECKKQFNVLMDANPKNAQFRNLLQKQLFKLNSQENQEYMLHNIFYLLSLIPKFKDSKQSKPEMKKVFKILLSNICASSDNPMIKMRYIDILNEYFKYNHITQEETQIKIMNSIIGANGIICSDLNYGYLYTPAFNSLIDKSVMSINKKVLEKINDNICEIVKSLILIKNSELLIQYHFIFKTSAISISQLDEDKQCLYVNRMINILLTIFDIYNDHNNAFIIMTQCLLFFFSRLTAKKGYTKLADLIYNFFDSYIKNRYIITALGNIKDLKTLFNVIKYICPLVSDKIIEIVNIVLAHEHNRIIKEDYIFYANFFADLINKLKNNTFKAIRLYFPSFHIIAKSVNIPTSNKSEVDRGAIMAFLAYSKIVNAISSRKTLNGFNEVGVVDIIRFEMLLCEKLDNNRELRIQSLAQICNTIVHRGLKKIIKEVMVDLLDCLFEIWRKDQSLLQLITSVHLAFIKYEDQSLYDNYLKGLFIPPSSRRELFNCILKKKEDRFSKNFEENNWIVYVIQSYYNKIIIH